MKEYHFDEPTTWVLNGREIKITKIESNIHEFTGKVNLGKELETIDPKVAITNVIKNTAQLSNGSFLEMNQDKIIARIQDVVGGTLIRNDWRIPKGVFNEIVSVLTWNDPETYKEYMFHVISKVS